MTRTTLVIAIIALSGCAGSLTTTVMRTDGSRLQAFPRCVHPDNGRLYGEGLEDGIPADSVAKLRSHAGMEMTFVGSAMLIVGASTVIWAMSQSSSENEWAVAVGGVSGGLGLIQVITGALLWNASAGSLGRSCHPRSSWGP